MSAMLRSMRATHLKVGLKLLPNATASALGAASRRLLASSAEAASTETSSSSSEPTRHVKLKSSLKRARGLAAKLRIEAKERRAAFLHDWRPDLPDFGVGDAIEVTYAHELSSKQADRILGTVIAKTHSGQDASFTIINEEGEDSYMINFLYSSPLIRGVRMVRSQHAFKKTGRRPRRAKLNYLWEGSPANYRVTQDTKEDWETQLEQRIKLELQARGRDASKQAIRDEKRRILTTGRGVLQAPRAIDDLTAADIRAERSRSAKSAGKKGGKGKGQGQGSDGRQ